MDNQKSFIRLVFIAVFMLICLCTPTCKLFSQTLAEDLKKINLKYLEASKYELNFSYKLYLDHVFDSETHSVFKKQNTSYYYSIEGYEALKADNTFIAMDHTEKTAIVRKNFKQSMKKSDLFKVDFNEITKSYKNVVRKLNGNLVEYTIDFSNSPYKTISIQFDSKTYFLTDMKIIYAEAFELDESAKKMPELVISIKTNFINPVFSKDQFSVNKFVSISKKMVALKPAYKDYQLYVFEN